MPTSTARAQPQGCTNFKLRQLLRSVSRLYDAQLAQADLKSSQYSLLSHVLAFGPITPSELAARMGMDASTLTRNVRPLIDKGWVAQTAGADARSRSIAITPAGREKHAEARQHWKRAQQSIERLLGAGEVAALHRTIDAAQALLNGLEHGEG